MKMDMAPMVGLGFLLITFFVFITTVSSTAVANLKMPDDHPVDISSNIPESLVLSVLMDEKQTLLL